MELLPIELIQHIASNLDETDTRNLASTCRYIRNSLSPIDFIPAININKLKNLLLEKMILDESPYFLYELSLHKYEYISFKTELERKEFIEKIYTVRKNNFLNILEQEINEVFTPKNIAQLREIFKPIKTRLYEKLPVQYNFSDLINFYGCLYQYNLVNYNFVREYKNYPPDKYLFTRGIDIFMIFLLERLVQYCYIYQRHNLPHILTLIRDGVSTQGNIYMTIQNILN